MADQNASIETLDFRPLVRQTVVVTPKAVETNGQVSRIELTVDGRQTGPPAHVHPGQEEHYYVQSGELTVTLNGEKLVLASGGEIHVPVGSTHTFANRSDTPVTFVAEHTPALRFEEYMRAIQSTSAEHSLNRRTPLTMIRLVRVESAYPETILAPPGMPRRVTGLMSKLGSILGYRAG